jgi:hypothetical protein
MSETTTDVNLRAWLEAATMAIARASTIEEVRRAHNSFDVNALLNDTSIPFYLRDAIRVVYNTTIARIQNTSSEAFKDMAWPPTTNS